MEFQIDPQEDYLDRDRSFFKIEMELNKANGDNVAAADRLWPVNNLAHSLFKQVSVRLNGALISPQTDTYHYKAYLKTMTNYDRNDGETVLKPQGWFKALDFSAILTASNTTVDQDGGNPHAHYTALPKDQRDNIILMKKEQAHYTFGKRHVLRFKPHIEAFQLNKLLVPKVQIGIQMYFFLNGVSEEGRLTAEDIKVRMYLCQVRLNPATYSTLMTKMEVERALVSYPTVRSEIRTFNMPGNEQRYECNNLFQGKIPNRVFVAIDLSTAFTENVVNDPFCFQKFGLSSIRQIVRGEEYPYETLELVQNDGTKDLRRYFRFLFRDLFSGVVSFFKV